MGMVHACKKSDYKDCASKEVEDTARGMKAKDAKDFASTKHKGLPDKKEKNEMKDLIKQMGKQSSKIAKGYDWSCIVNDLVLSINKSNL